MRIPTASWNGSLLTRESYKNLALPVMALLDTLDDLPTGPPSLYVDLEGIHLSRQGSVSIIELFVLPHQRVYLLDAHVLGKQLFSIKGTSSQTLKPIFNRQISPRSFMTFANDSDALYSHFQIHLQGVHDLQLMELGSWSFSKRCVNGLAKNIEKDAPMTMSEKAKWQSIKNQGGRLFRPELGGSYEIFNARPLSDDIANYCVQDVQYLPGL